jgi:hypothetical protein
MNAVKLFSFVVVAALAAACSSQGDSGAAQGAKPGPTVAPQAMGRTAPDARGPTVGGANGAVRPPPGAQTGSTILGGQPGGPTVAGGPQGGPGAPPSPPPPAAPSKDGRCAFWGEACQNCAGPACLKDTYACTGDADCAAARATASRCLCEAENKGESTKECLAAWSKAGPVSAALAACTESHCAATCGFR